MRLKQNASIPFFIVWDKFNWLIISRKIQKLSYNLTVHIKREEVSRNGREEEC